MTETAVCAVHDQCEGGSLHIKCHDQNGCAQFQDGSWMTTDRCPRNHPGQPAGIGEADRTRAWLERELDWFLRGAKT